MNKGQIFILTAFVIALGIAALANLGYFTSLPVQKEQTAIGAGSSALHNIDVELIYITRLAPSNVTRIDDFLLFIQNYTLEKNLEGTIIRTTG